MGGIFSRLVLFSSVVHPTPFELCHQRGEASCTLLSSVMLRFECCVTKPALVGPYCAERTAHLLGLMHHDSALSIMFMSNVCLTCMIALHWAGRSCLMFVSNAMLKAMLRNSHAMCC